MGTREENADGSETPRGSSLGGRACEIGWCAPMMAHPWIQSSYLARYVFLNSVGIADYLVFPARRIENEPPVFCFAKDDGFVSEVANCLRVLDPQSQTDPVEGFLTRTGTVALLIVGHDRLLLERYAAGRERASVCTSFSIAKSFTSALIGIAIGEGLIGSLDDRITRYLPDLRGPHWASITLRHLVSMTSGLKYNLSGFWPWQDEPRVYYSLDLRHLARRARYAEPPGRSFHYNNYNAVLLGMVLERVAGAPVSRYLQDKIWRPLGMEYPASWSLDSARSGMEKMESGLNAVPVDFAKFGRLYLRRGDWDGRQVVPESWVTESTTNGPPPRAASYGYLWWTPREGRGRYMAVGNLAQFLYVAPDKDVVILRFGRARSRDWREFFPRIFASLADAL
jgi:CubicO group peptidase (beta-lactamase class C family)